MLRPSVAPTLCEELWFCQSFCRSNTCSSIYVMLKVEFVRPCTLVQRYAANRLRKGRFVPVGARRRPITLERVLEQPMRLRARAWVRFDWQNDCWTAESDWRPLGYHTMIVESSVITHFQVPFLCHRRSQGLRHHPEDAHTRAPTLD